MDSEEGHAFIKNLAYFVRTHEKALANAQLLQRRNSHQVLTPGSPIVPKSPSSPSPASTFLHLPFTSRPPKPAKLTLTPHHLFYLLSRFQELGIVVGPMDVRLENIHNEAAPTNYVSFLNQAQRQKIRGPDQGSIHSVSSIRSVMSTMTSLWSSLGLTGRPGRSEKHKTQEKEDLKYLYSAFTKVPCLKLAPDHNAPLIAGYEEFPFDSAVPLFAFKNANTLEVCDVDFRQFYGWDRLADHVRSLTVKNACVVDLTDLLVNIVLDDMDKRRRRSARVIHVAMNQRNDSPSQKQTEFLEPQSLLSMSPLSQDQHQNENEPATTSFDVHALAHTRSRSHSPTRPTTVRESSKRNHERSSTPMRDYPRRSSGSSTSSPRATTPRGSSSTLTTPVQLSYTKWRFLRHLSLAENSLDFLPSASLAPIARTLQSLDLSHNSFSRIPDGLSAMLSLRALNLSHCMIDSLHSLSRHPLPAVTALNLRGNRLASLAGVEMLQSLQRIDIRENQLADPVEIARMTGIPNMVDVYIHKNPLVKGFANHRVTIFNLFRQTPGYTQDVFLDGTQPSYSERKQLVDRAPMPLQPAVVRQPHLDKPTRDSPPSSVPPSNTPQGVASLEDLQLRRQGSSSSHQRKRSELGHSSKRRKGARRRLVDISQKDVFVEARGDEIRAERPAADPGSHASLPHTDANVMESSQPTPRDEVPHGKVEVPTALPDTIPLRPKLTGLKTSPAAPQLLRTGSDPTYDPLTPTLYLDGERYRQRIESLRQDLGNGWLSALGDETWDNDLLRDITEQHFPGAGQLDSPPRAIHATSQGLTSASRILG